MKKLVLVAAMFMFVCGSSFLAMAQKPAQSVQTVESGAVKDTVVTDSTQVKPVTPDTTATPQPAI